MTDTFHATENQNAEAARPGPAFEQLMGLAGMDAVKQALGPFALGHVTGPAPHFILTGNPGTGKTMLAKRIGQLFCERGYLESGRVVCVSRADLVGEYVGQTAAKTRECVERALGGVLFVDEAYALADSFSLEALETLVELMEKHKGKFIVIFAGYPDGMERFAQLNLGLTARCRRLHIDDYTPDELAHIFRQMCAEQKALCAPELDGALPALFANMKARAKKLFGWGNAHEAENLLREMLALWANDKELAEGEDGSPVRVLTERHIPEALRPCLEQEAAGSDLRIVAGSSPSKPKYLEQAFCEVSRSVSGRVVCVTRADLVGKYVGQTAAKTRACFERALGGVLLVGEAHTLADGGFGEEAIDTLTELLNEHKGELTVVLAGPAEKLDEFLNKYPALAIHCCRPFMDGCAPADGEGSQGD